MTQPTKETEAHAEALCFADLPDEVLSLVASLGLTELRDVASFAAVSKRCMAVVAAAPLRLAVCPAVDASATPQEEQAAARASLQTLCATWPGMQVAVGSADRLWQGMGVHMRLARRQSTAELDMRGCPLEDPDILAALRALPSLAVLHLSGCKKLTPFGCTAVLCGSGGGAGGSAGSTPLPPRSPLRTITLQRCFQLTAAALSDVLAAAAAPGCKLACAALSHLSLDGWSEAAGRGPPVGRLRMLALHNCAKLGDSALVAIAAACPRLEVLMLGGCTFAVEELPADGGPACSVSHGHCSEAANQPWGAGSPKLHPAQFYEAALAAVVSGVPGAGAGGYASYVASLAASLAALAARLPQLRVLELTFAPPGLVPALQHLAATEPLLLAGRPEPLEVWDLCTAASVGQALQWRRGVAAAAATAGSGMHSGPAITPGDAAAFLSAAVNCSSGSRAAPLHSAAEEGGDPALLRALLGLGAAVDARTRSGATPLFLACEAGRARAVECLLGAGAAIHISNSADEAPLYISALKGHEQCVELLLEHCQRRGISWQRLRSDDGWTPLMAAAVGPGRASIVLKLLQAAGAEAPALVQAANRYGQTALHVAARKAGPSLLRSLVDAGGAASLLAADADGRLPLDIAKRNNNGSAMRVLADAGGGAAALRRELARQRGTVPTAERPRANDCRQQHPPQRWVGRRLQQRKGGGGGGDGAQGGGAAGPSGSH